MEEVNSDQPKILERIFLSKFYDVQVQMCSPGHPNLKVIGSPQTKQCIDSYRKNSKEKKEP